MKKHQNNKNTLTGNNPSRPNKEGIWIYNEAKADK